MTEYFFGEGRGMIYLLHCVRKKILCDIRSCRRVKKREKYIGRMLVCQRQTEEHERRTGTRLDPMGKWRSGRARVAALNFLWNLLTIKYELACSVILNFRMCPLGFVLPIRGECHPFPTIRSLP